MAYELMTYGLCPNSRVRRPVEKLVAAFVVLSGLLMISVGTMGRF